MTSTSTEPALVLDHVSKVFTSGWGSNKQRVGAVLDVSFRVEPNTVMGLVGESGSGKSTIGRMAVGLIEPTSGTIVAAGRDLSEVKGKELRLHRRKMQMVFQDSASSLNPRMTLEDLLIEPLRVQGLKSKAERKKAAQEVADEVGLARTAFGRLPPEFSGGQRQRISIARALIPEPSFIVADEPVSALDVSVQAQVLNLLKDIKSSRGLSMLFISHDLSVVKFMTDNVSVLYLGRRVEEAKTNSLYEDAKHPYSQALLSTALSTREGGEVTVLPGEIPNPANPPSGCPFRTRCPKVMDICSTEYPATVHTGGSNVSCYLYTDHGDTPREIIALSTPSKTKAAS